MKEKKKPISIASRKAKGRRLQNWVAQKISKLTGYAWGKDEMIAPREMGQAGADVRLVADAKEAFPWATECKNTEKASLWEWVAQAKANQSYGTDWLVFHKKNNSEEIVILDAEVFFDILARLPGYKKGR